MSKPFVIRRKDNLDPIVLTFELPDADEKGKEITRTVEFRCVPHVSGKEMLRLSSLQDVDFAAGMNESFERFIVPEDYPAWEKFLEGPNSLDLDELGKVFNDLIGKYANRQSENPSQGSR